MSESVLIFVKELDGLGGAIEHSELKNIEQTSHSLWFHFDANHPDAMEVIRNDFPDIDEHSLQAIFDQDARPRMLDLDSGLLIILRGINHNEGDEPEDMIALRFWITTTRIISLRYRKSRAVEEVAKSFGNKRGPKTIGDIFAAISFKMFCNIEIGVSTLEDKIAILESQVLEKPDKQLRINISDLRKTIILLRRYIAPQKEVIKQLNYAEIDWLSSRNIRRIHEAHDILVRSVEGLDAVRERSQIIKDDLVNALSDRLNRNLYVLSVITAIFLPLGFLTGLFGINIGGMPGVDNNMAFSIFSIGLIVVVFIQIILFKLFKWL
jgi:zinc transporter